MAGFDHKSPISERERDYVWRIVDGHKDIIMIIGRFRALCEDAKSLPYMLCLHWLIEQRITGKKFLDYYQQEHKGSLIHMAAYIRKGAMRDYQLRKIIAN